MNNERHIKTWRLLAILLLIVGTLTVGVGRTHAAPLLQGEGTRIGLFGTVTAIVDTTIVLDSGDTVATDEDTRFFVPGVDDASLADISVADRLAIVAVELEDGSLLALDIMSTPEEPVNTDHVLGVVTGDEDGLVTLTDEQGNTFTLELPPGVAVAVGDYLTVVSGLNGDAGELSASDVATVEDVIDRLADDIEEAIDEAKDLLRELLGNNGDQYLTALVNTIEHASDEAKDALEAALNSTHSHLEEKYHGAGVDGPYVKVKGFITASTSTSVTVDSIDDGELTLEITEATEIEDTIAVGDFVKVKYNLDLVAKKIELRSDKLEFEGAVATSTPSLLVLEDGTSFAIDDGTEIEGDLVPEAYVEVKARPGSGAFYALKIKVEGEDEDEDEGEEYKFKGPITALSPDDGPPTELQVSGFPLPVMITSGTEIKGDLMEGAKVKVEVTDEGDHVNALVIEVKEPEYDEDEEDEYADIEFEGIVESFDLSATSAPNVVLVDGPSLFTDGDTRYKGTLFVGAEVEVKAEMLPDGTLLAVKIEVEAYEDNSGEGSAQHDEEGEDSSVQTLKFEGIVAGFTSAELTLEDDTSVAVDDGTEVKGTLYVGAEVEVEAIELPGGTLLAIKIRVQTADEDDE